MSGLLLSSDGLEIERFTTNQDLVDALADKVSSDDLATALGDYSTTDAINTTLQSYTTSAVLASDGGADLIGRRTVAELLADTSDPRGEGSTWYADGFTYIEAASGATDHHVETAGGVKLYVQPASDGAYHTAALGPQSGAEITDKLNALIASAENGVLVFDYDPLGYLTDSIIFPDNVTVWGSPGTLIGKVTGGIRVFHIAGVSNVKVFGNGMTLNGNDTGSSHTLYINQSEDILVNDLHVIGAGTTGDDCIYLGGAPDTGDICRNIEFNRVTCEGLATTRSGLVLAAVHGFVARNCKFSNGGGSMENSNGLDIEPNKWMSRDKDGQCAVQDVWFYKCDFHGSREQGCALGGNNMHFTRCRFYDNGKQGAATSSNPYVTDFAKYRTGDLLGVSAVSTGDGWLTVTTGTSGVDLLTEDYKVEVGAVIGLFGTNNSASWPTEVNSRMVIAEIDSTQSKIRVAEDYIYNKVTSFSGGSYSTMDTDPETADLYIWVATKPGVNSNIKMIDCEWYDNAQDGVSNNPALSLAFGYNIQVIRPKIISNDESAGHDGIVGSWSYKTLIDTPDITANPLGVAADGIRISIASKWKIIEPNIRHMGRNGLDLQGFTESGVRGGNILNCGTTTGPAVSIAKGDHGETTGLVVRNDEGFRSSTGNGYHIQNTVTNHTVTSVQTWGHSSDDPFKVQGTGHIIQSCFENDERQAELATATATNIADASHSINTAGKYTGKIIRDTTNNRLLFSIGSAATSRWDVADGSASVTPS